MLPPAPLSTVSSGATETRVTSAAAARLMLVSGANDAPATPPTMPLSTALRLVGLLFPPSWRRYTPAISPVLSPRLLSSRPALLTTVRCKFDIVVNSGIVRCCPPRIVPHPPPTSITGNG